MECRTSTEGGSKSSGLIKRKTGAEYRAKNREIKKGDVVSSIQLANKMHVLCAFFAFWTNIFLNESEHYPAKRPKNEYICVRMSDFYIIIDITYAVFDCFSYVSEEFSQSESVLNTYSVLRVRRVMRSFSM